MEYINEFHKQWIERTRQSITSWSKQPASPEEVKKQLNGYLVTKELEDLDSYIVLPSLNDNQGIMGALKLAVDELAMQ